MTFMCFSRHAFWVRCAKGTKPQILKRLFFFLLPGCELKGTPVSTLSDSLDGCWLILSSVAPLVASLILSWSFCTRSLAYLIRTDTIRRILLSCPSNTGAECFLDTGEFYGAIPCKKKTLFRRLTIQDRQALFLCFFRWVQVRARRNQKQGHAWEESAK